MKSKKIIIISIVVIILIFIACGAAVYISKQNLENAKKDLQQTIEKYGYVEKEKVNVTVAKFNTEIMESGLNTPINSDTMVMDDGTYWYGITKNISLYVEPVEYSKNVEEDVTKIIALYCYKEGYNEKTSLKYAKELLKANNYDFTEDEINNLIEEAKNVSDKRQMANNGKGISLAIIEADDHYEYQVKRLYLED